MDREVISTNLLEAILDRSGARVDVRLSRAVRGEFERFLLSRRKGDEGGLATLIAIVCPQWSEAQRRVATDALCDHANRGLLAHLSD